MDEVRISDLADVSRDHLTTRDGVLRAINRLELVMGDPSAWRMRDKPSSVHYLRLRRDLPYCLHPTDIQGTRLLVNRNYKPIGSSQETEWAKYEEYTNSHVQLTEKQLSEVAGDNAYMFGDVYGDPWSGKKEARAYLKRLRKLFGML